MREYGESFDACGSRDSLYHQVEADRAFREAAWTRGMSAIRFAARLSAVR